MAEQGWIIGLDPTRGGDPAGSAGASARLAPRPASLAGAVIGVISNQKARATEFLQRVYEILATGDDLAGQVLVTKDSVFSPPTADDWSRLRAGATVAITGYGG
jgi:hypothetical protein